MHGSIARDKYDERRIDNVPELWYFDSEWSVLVLEW